MTDARRGMHAFIVLGAIAVTLLLLGGLRQFSPVQDALGVLTSPIQGVLHPVASEVRGFLGRLLPGRLQAENRELRAKVDRLTADNVRLQGLQFENEQLRQQLGFTGTRKDLTLLNARVIGQDPSSLRQYLLLDQGSDHGVQPGMAVTHPGGALIGQVLRVEAGRSEVLLVTDVESSVNARIQRTRADGIVEGRWQQGELLRMRYIEQGPTADGQARVREGDWVVTSGLGGNVPSGLLIGQVGSVQGSDTGLEQQAQVLPATDARAVEAALIVLRQES